MPGLAVDRLENFLGTLPEQVFGDLDAKRFGILARRAGLGGEQLATGGLAHQPAQPELIAFQPA